MEEKHFTENRVTYRKHLSQPWFDLISSGTKIWEGRLRKGDFLKIKTGDVVIWYNESKEVKTKITDVKMYESFNRGIEELGLENVLPTEFDLNKTIDQAVEDVYYKYFNREEELKFTTVFFKISVLNEKF